MDQIHIDNNYQDAYSIDWDPNLHYPQYDDKNYDLKHEINLYLLILAIDFASKAYDTHPADLSSLDLEPEHEQRTRGLYSSDSHILRKQVLRRVVRTKNPLRAVHVGAVNAGMHGVQFLMSGLGTVRGPGFFQTWQAFDKIREDVVKDVDKSYDIIPGKPLTAKQLEQRRNDEQWWANAMRETKAAKSERARKFSESQEIPGKATSWGDLVQGSDYLKRQKIVEAEERDQKKRDGRTRAHQKRVNSHWDDPGKHHNIDKFPQKSGLSQFERQYIQDYRNGGYSGPISRQVKNLL